MHLLKALLTSVTLLLVAGALQAAEPLRILLITGGHEYETNAFQAMFQADPGIRVISVTHPNAQAWFAPEHAQDYDVLVSYDMWQDITDEAKANLLSRVREGKGFLAMHHCLASYSDWDDYARLIGGKYHLAPWRQDGRDRPGSVYQHDVEFRVRVSLPDHPVTRGVKDFTIHDETYGGFEVKADVTPLLETEEPTSGPVLAWTRQEQKGRVVYLQLGHDHLAYENPAFRRIVAQAIRYVANRH